jgi:hypothetical protein
MELEQMDAASAAEMVELEAAEIALENAADIETNAPPRPHTTAMNGISISEARNSIDKLTRLHVLDADLIAAQRACEDAHDLHKAAKAAVEKATDKLLAELRKSPAEPLPLIDGVPSDATSASQASASNGKDAWRGVPIADLGLSAATRVAMGDAGIFTIGGISDWSAEKPLTDIKGVGQKKADEIDAALVRYWELHGCRFGG